MQSVLIFTCMKQTLLLLLMAVALSVHGQEPEMVFVKGGVFNYAPGTLDIDTVLLEKMSRSNAYANPAKAYHIMPGTVTTLSDFYIGKYEITIREFRAFIKATGYKTDADKDGFSYVLRHDMGPYDRKGVNWECNTKGDKRSLADDRYPAIYISYNDAIAYCKWLTAKTGKKYRLPTDAEWEYAAKGGIHKDTFVFSGSNCVDSVSSIKGDLSYEKVGRDSFMKAVIWDVSVAGSYKPNSLGIYDMTGNALEWCSDWYYEMYYAGATATNPQGPPTGDSHVLRGGSWTNNGYQCRLKDTGRPPLMAPGRERGGAKGHPNTFGCRVVREQ